MVDKSQNFLDWYKGDGVERTEPPQEQSEIARRIRERLQDPTNYRPAPEVRDAVNVALLMSMPLIVCGEPGSGKTQLGYSIAHELGLGEPHFFTCKSTTEAGELFYNYDAIRHYHRVQVGGESSAGPFIHLNALGKAIIAALPAEQRGALADPASSPQVAKRSVVIVDEIDKTSVDFSNDLLFEFENLRFAVPELEGFITPQIEEHLRPILIITTNEQSALPRAFLRRCVCVTIPAPSGAELVRLIENRFRDVMAVSSPLMRDVVTLTDRLRNSKQIENHPSTAEMLQFVAGVLESGGEPDVALVDQPIDLEVFVYMLSKSHSDHAQIMTELQQISGNEVVSDSEASA